VSRRWEPSPRRPRRNLLLLAGLVPSVVATAVALALLLMLARQAAGEAATARGQHDAAAQSFAANRWFATVEHWVAPYNEGVASFRAERYEAALSHFAAALRQAPPERECLVRHNLAVTRERLGDVEQAGSDTRALELYRTAREALLTGDCLERDDGPPALREESRQLDERLVDKIEGVLAEQERDDLARLPPPERKRAEELEVRDELAARREQRLKDYQESRGPSGEEYGW